MVIFSSCLLISCQRKCQGSPCNPPRRGGGSTRMKDLLGGVQQRVLLILGEGVGALVVLDVVHNLVDTSLMVLEEGGGHNWVQANNVGLDPMFVEIKVLVHPANGHEHACIVLVLLHDPIHDLVV